jgi:hypothetical protein
MEARGEFVLPRRRFTLALANKSIIAQRLGGDMVIEGLRLKESEADHGQRDWDR